MAEADVGVEEGEGGEEEWATVAEEGETQSQ